MTFQSRKIASQGSNSVCMKTSELSQSLSQNSGICQPMITLLEALTESSATDSDSAEVFDSSDSSSEPEDTNVLEQPGIKSAPETIKATKSEVKLLYKIIDNIKIFTNQQEKYVLKFNKEAQHKTDNRNECQPLFHLRLVESTENCLDVLLFKSPGEIKSLDAMYEGHSKFQTQLYCSSVKNERLASFETNKGNYDVTMCATHASDEEMKNRLKKFSEFVSKTYQMNFSRGEARTFPILRNTDISSTPKYKFSDLRKKFKIFRHVKQIKLDSTLKGASNYREVNLQIPSQKQKGPTVAVPSAQKEVEPKTATRLNQSNVTQNDKNEHCVEKQKNELNQLEDIKIEHREDHSRVLGTTFKQKGPVVAVASAQKEDETKSSSKEIAEKTPQQKGTKDFPIYS